MPTPEQDAYVSETFGVDFAKYQSATGGATNGGDAAPDAALASANADIFFARDSADLTSSARAALDHYALAMGGPGQTTGITADGYASVDGSAQRNQRLGAQRAEAVAAYLSAKGFAKARVTAKGHGATAAFDPADPRRNRRVTLAPPPPSQPAAMPPASRYDPLPPDPRFDALGSNPFLRHPDLVPLAPPVTRVQVARELTEFLTDLQYDQGGRSVKVTDKVRVAGDALAKGLGQSQTRMYALLQDDKFNFVPAELARRMADTLPDVIPEANHQAFLALKPKEVAKPEQFSVAGALAKVLSPTVHKALSFLPDDLRKIIEKAMEDAVAAGLVAIVDKAMGGAPLDDQTKAAIHSGVEAAIHSGVEAAIKLKPPVAPPADGGGAGKPEPAPSTVPPTKSMPGETILKSPSVPIPDVPDDTAKKRDDETHKQEQRKRNDGS